MLCLICDSEMMKMKKLDRLSRDVKDMGALMMRLAARCIEVIVVVQLDKLALGSAVA